MSWASLVQIQPGFTWINCIYKEAAKLTCEKIGNKIVLIFILTVIILLPLLVSFTVMLRHV